MNAERNREIIPPEKRSIDFVKSAVDHFFPENPTIAKLFEQHLLTGHSDDPEKLQQAMQERSIQDTISIIEVYEHANISVEFEGTTRYIVTHNLNGCTATVTCAEDIKGKRTVQMTHFPPFMVERQKQSISAMKTELPQNAKKKTILFTKINVLLTYLN